MQEAEQKVTTLNQDVTVLELKWGDPVALPVETVSLSNDWNHYEYTWDLNGFFPNDTLEDIEDAADSNLKARIDMNLSDGIILMDDLVLERTDLTNPTDFTDDLVQTLQDANVSTIRLVHECGDSLTNLVQERMFQKQFDNSLFPKKGFPRGEASWWMRNRAYTIPEQYRLCEYLGIDGDMLETEQENIPSFDARWGTTKAKLKDGTYDTIHSYAFRKGKQRTLLLFNLDIDNPQNIKLQFDGTPDGDAERWLLTGDSYDAINHEIGTPPAAALTQDSLEQFKNGITIEIPVCSTLGLKWTEQ